MIESLAYQALTLVVVVGALGLILRAAVPTRRSGAGRIGTHARSLGWLTRYRDSSMWSVLIVGAASLAAVAQSSHGVPPTGTGAGYGAFVALMTVVGFETARDLVVGALSAVATVMQFVMLVADEPGPVARGYRVVVALLVTAAFFVGRSVGAFLPGTRKLSIRSVLVFFAVIDALAFLASPLGVSVLQLDLGKIPLYIAAATIGAFLLGVLAYDVIVALAAAGVTITALMYAGAGLDAQLSFIVSATVAAAIVLLVRQVFG